MERPDRAIKFLKITFPQLLAGKRKGLGKGKACHKAGKLVRTSLVKADPGEGTIPQPSNLSLSSAVCHHHLEYVVVVILVVVIVIVVVVVVVIVVVVGVYSIESIDS